MLPSIDTKSAPAVAEFVRSQFAVMYPGQPREWLNRVFCDVETCFSGRHPDYAPSDLGYHDLEHTLQATVCLVRILAGRQRAGAEPAFSVRDFELAVAAVLLHDTGYLKLRSDTRGTGAKYTHIHVLRSCAFAASYLPNLGADDREIEGVLGAIRCTGPTSKIEELHFRASIEKVTGCILSTADYLGQMAAADYPDELEILFKEFNESYEFFRLPPERRFFKSARELISKTPDFWLKVVLPKLDRDYGSVYRYLATPYPDGPNPYLLAIEANLAEVRRRIAVAEAIAS